MTERSLRGAISDIEDHADALVDLCNVMSVMARAGQDTMELLTPDECAGLERIVVLAKGHLKKLHDARRDLHELTKPEQEAD